MYNRIPHDTAYSGCFASAESLFSLDIIARQLRENHSLLWSLETSFTPLAIALVEIAVTTILLALGTSIQLSTV